MIAALTWQQTFNLWWIFFACGFGWQIGKGLGTPVARALRRRITIPLARIVTGSADK